MDSTGEMVSESLNNQNDDLEAGGTTGMEVKLDLEKNMHRESPREEVAQMIA